MERRLHERQSASFHVEVTELSTPEISVSGEVKTSGRAHDISASGIGVDLALEFKPGSAVRLKINDSVLFGFVAYSKPEKSRFRTGIELVQVLIGTSDIAQLLKATLHESMPTLPLESTQEPA
jgi:hypothetical protein